MMTDYIYVVAIISTDKEIIPLSNVESINADISVEDKLSAVLKDDYCIRVTTLSGNRHICSMKETIKLIDTEQYFGFDVVTPELFYIDHVYKSWLSKYDKTSTYQ